MPQFRGDDGLLDHERIRLLAVQQTNPADASSTRVAEAETLAAFILGPEARKPFPQQDLTELYEFVRGMLPDSSSQSPWRPPESIEVKYEDLLRVFCGLALLAEEPPF